MFWVFLDAEITPWLARWKDVLAEIMIDSNPPLPKYNRNIRPARISVLRAPKPVQLHRESFERKQGRDITVAIMVTARCSSRHEPETTLHFDEALTMLALGRLFKSVIHTFVVLLHE